MEYQLKIKVKKILGIEDADDYNSSIKKYIFKAEVLNNYNNKIPSTFIAFGEFNSKGFHAFAKNNTYDVTCAHYKNKNKNVFEIINYCIDYHANNDSFIKYFQKYCTLLTKRDIKKIFDDGNYGALNFLGANIFEDTDKQKEYDIVAKQLSDYLELIIDINGIISLLVNIKAIDKFYSQYKANSIEKFNKNPYILVSFGSDFFEIYNREKIMSGDNEDSVFEIKNSNNIMQCFLYLSLKDAYENNGDIFLKADELYNSVKYQCKEKDIKFCNDIYNKIILDEKFDFPIRVHDGKYYIEHNYNVEQFIIEKINLLNIERTGKWGKNLREYLKKNSESLDSNQIQAIRNVFKEQLSIIAGGAGTGKTYLIKKIIEAISMVDDKSSIALLAPTGKAVERLRQATNFDAKTIHRFIEYNGFTKLKKSSSIDVDYLIIDEASMIDNNIFAELLDVLKDNVTLILVGDTNQLSPIGAGDLFFDLCSCNDISKTTLQNIYRQGENSNIVSLAISIINGKADLETNLIENDLKIYNVKYDKEILKQLQTEKIDYKNSQILSLTNINKIGVDSINTFVRSQLKFEINEFVETDKVMQTKNNPILNVFNGETGVVHQIVKDQTNFLCFVDFSGNIVKYQKRDLRELTYSYAMTVHKSQGSEFDTVILILDNASQLMIDKSILYTAVTRAKKELVIINAIPNINKLIKKNTRRRNSNIAINIKKVIL